jgi:hypothetical protein
MASVVPENSGTAGILSHPAGEVVELALLLPAGQAAALEAAAGQQGLAVGPLLRGLIRDFLEQSPFAARVRSVPGRA